MMRMRRIGALAMALALLAPVSADAGKARRGPAAVKRAAQRARTRRQLRKRPPRKSEERARFRSSLQAQRAARGLRSLRRYQRRNRQLRRLRKKLPHLSRGPSYLELGVLNKATKTRSETRLYLSRAGLHIGTQSPPGWRRPMMWPLDERQVARLNLRVQTVDRVVQQSLERLAQKDSAALEAQLIEAW